MPDNPLLAGGAVAVAGELLFVLVMAVVMKRAADGAAPEPQPQANRVAVLLLRLSTWFRLGLGLGVAYSVTNPNPNPNPPLTQNDTATLAEEPRPGQAVATSADSPRSGLD